jgi:peptidyl-prolyl cis-trans isomerase A (cyclophilin A)
MRAILLALFFIAACSEPEVEPAPPPPPPAAPPTPPAPAPKPVRTDILTALPAGHHPALLDPSKATATAPEKFQVTFTTTKGPFVVEVTRAWSPLGADRFYNLVQAGYFDSVGMFRNVKGFMVQFGISGFPEVNTAWSEAKITDDPVTQSNTRGMITFATSGKDTRTTQVFINHKNNTNLDAMGFSPFGTVVSGMDIVDALYSGYGDGPPRGRGPNQGKLQAQGNTYLLAQFPELDYVLHARIVE